MDIMIQQPIKIRLTNILNGYHDTATNQDKIDKYIKWIS